MTTIEWIVLGALLLAVLIFCARIARRGLSTLDDDRERQQARIDKGRHQLDEDRKNMSAHEHLSIIMAGLEDLARLDDCQDECLIRRNGANVEFHTPQGDYEIELLMRERMLKSTQKVLHGRYLWLLRGNGINEKHGELATLMASLQAHRQGTESETFTPEHLSRRLRKPRAIARKS